MTRRATVLLIAFAVAGAAGAIPAQAAEPAFVVDAVRFSGVTAIDGGRLQELLRDIPGREITLADLEAAAARVTAYYRERGYPAAYAYIPPQTIADGVVEVAVLEGRLSGVDLVNASRLNNGIALRLLLPLKPGALIESRSLAAAAEALSSVPGVRGQVALADGGAPGTATLVARLADDRMFEGSLAFDNHGNPSTGVLRTTVTGAFNNPTGFGDRIVLQAMTSGPGLTFGRLAYDVPPLFGRGRWRASYSAIDYELGGAFSALQAAGTAKEATLFASYPLVRSAGHHTDFELRWGRRALEDAIMGSVSLRRSYQVILAVSGERRASSGFGADAYEVSWAGGVLAIDDAATRADDQATGKTAGPYSKLNLALNSSRRFGDGWAASVSARAQWATKNLHPSEKLSIGGPGGVRADGDAGSGDDALVVRIELSRDVSVFSPLPGRVRWFGFADAGWARPDKQPWQPGEAGPVTHSGAGFGFVYAPSPRLSLRLEYGRPLGPEAAGAAPALWMSARWEF